MITINDLKEYLIGDNGYLLDNNNNGKTIMISGVWGSGKTHFWQKEIEPRLSEKLKEDQKACVYISLYGKDNIEAIKSEILFKAYESIKDENKIAKRAISAFGFTSSLLSISYAGVRANTNVVGEAIENLFESKKINEAKSFLADGGLICFDDFERKSKNVDLNDLFGFISQLAVELKCKVVIILNSDVFKDKEANIFKTVKEKTINKFFYFEPTIEELFNSIYNSDKKYRKLDKYKDEILKAIIETKELNARIYIQVLDNCLEWLNKYDYDRYQLRALVLITANFIKNHFVFDYRVLNGNSKLYKVIEQYYNDEGLYEIANYFVKIIPQNIKKWDDEYFDKYLNSNRTKEPNKTSCGRSNFLHFMRSSILDKKTDKEGNSKYSENYYLKLEKVFEENKKIFSALHYYAYFLEVERGVDKNIFDKINNFVKTGILINKNNSENI